MINIELECPGCNHKFVEDDYYNQGDCPNCNSYYYYWDHVYNEDENEVYFEGYYWEKLKFMKTNLYVFDFDGTLCASLLPDEGKKAYERIKGEPYPHKGWWGRSASLLPEYNTPTRPEILADYNRAKTDKNGITVLLTNRIVQLGHHIMNILDANGLAFDVVSFKQDNRTKSERAADIMKNYADVRYVEFWDDMIEHVEDFERMKVMRPDITLKINHVK